MDHAMREILSTTCRRLVVLNNYMWSVYDRMFVCSAVAPGSGWTLNSLCTVSATPISQKFNYRPAATHARSL